MIVAAALCPPAPLLLPGVTGTAVLLPALSEACAGAVATVLAARPEVVLVAGADGPAVTAASFAPMLALRQPRRPPWSPQPLGMLVARHLLDTAGWRGPVASATPTTKAAGRAALLAVADGPEPWEGITAELTAGLDWEVLYDDQPFGVRYLVAAATRSARAMAS